MKIRRKKVGIFTHNYPITSMERKDAGIFVYDFSQELFKQADVFIFCPDFGGKKEKYKNVPVKWMDWGGPKIKFGNWSFYSPISVFNFFKLIIRGCQEAEKFAKENKLDYVLACWTMPSSIYALWVNFRLKTPYSVWILGSDLNIYAKFPILKQLTFLALKKARNRFSNSYFLINATQKLSGEKCNYLSAITDFHEYKVETKELPKVFNFLVVSRLEKVKGPDILLKACCELRNKTEKFFVHILGDGTMREGLEKYTKENNLYKNVKLYGNASKEVITSFMKSSDALIVASRAESIPLVMVEASRFGVPTISTDVGDSRYTINKYKIGYITKSEDPVSLSNGMYNAIKEGKKFKKSRAGGLKKLADDYKQEKTVAVFMNELNSI